jgi:hypothetical protein
VQRVGATIATVKVAARYTVQMDWIQ